MHVCSLSFQFLFLMTWYPTRVQSTEIRKRDQFSLFHFFVFSQHTLLVCHCICVAVPTPFFILTHQQFLLDDFLARRGHCHNNHLSRIHKTILEQGQDIARVSLENFSNLILNLLLQTAWLVDWHKLPRRNIPQSVSRSIDKSCCGNFSLNSLQCQFFVEDKLRFSY